MTEPVTGFSSTTSLQVSKSGSPPLIRRTSEGVDPREAIEQILKPYSGQLVDLVATERDLDSSIVSTMDGHELLHLLPGLVQRQMDNRERIELLFAELSRKMWKGQLPAISVAIIERQYSESTGRLLNEDLRDTQWSAYFTAFQLSLDILNGRT